MEPRVQLDDQAIIQRLRQLHDGFAVGSANALGAMNAIARFMKTSTQLRFTQGRAPDGRPWWPSNRAKSQGGQTLRDSNRLFRSLTWRAGPGFAEAGTNVPYAAAHHYGVRKMVNVPVHRRNMKGVTKTGRAWAKSVPVKAHVRLMFLPRREIFGFSQTDRVEILAILTRHAEKLVGT